VILPPGFNAKGVPRPLVVSLHSWSFGVEQRWPEVEKQVEDREWIWSCPLSADRFRLETQAAEARLLS
jgi:hypothetical protein